jgi:hypothetical protein
MSTDTPPERAAAQQVTALLEQVADLFDYAEQRVPGAIVVCRHQRRRAPSAAASGQPDEHAPAHRPRGPGRPIEEDDGVARCAGCGCTEDAPCPGGCWWVPNPTMVDLCSACAYGDAPGPAPR